MLNHPTLDKLHNLKLSGMATAFTEQLGATDIDALSFEERLGLLVDREMTYRDSRRMTSRLRRAKLRHNACFEDLDLRYPRELDKGLITSMASGQWIHQRFNVLITGPSGIGKTWIACALAHQACREGFSALYQRLPRLLGDVALARGDGRYPKLLASLAKLDLLVIDDWGLAKLTPEHLRDLSKWHELIGEPTFADAILDRLVHNAYKFKLKGDSMRKKKTKTSQADHFPA
jgi:DNA replication protein DnaC